MANILRVAGKVGLEKKITALGQKMFNCAAVKSGQLGCQFYNPSPPKNMKKTQWSLIFFSTCPLQRSEGRLGSLGITS